MDFEGMLETFYSQLDLAGKLVVDVGGHTGRHSFPLSQLVGATGTVYAFEPLPTIRNQFLMEIALRGVINIVVFPFALATYRGLTEFLFIPNIPGESGLKERKIYNGVPSEVVRIDVGVRRLDDLVPEHYNVSFLKIDAEGGELDILRGAEQMIHKSRPVVAFECGAASFLGYHDTPEWIFDIFANADYLVFSITGVKVENRLQFRGFSHEQKFWDYIAIPREQSHLANLLTD